MLGLTVSDSDKENNAHIERKVSDGDEDKEYESELKFRSLDEENNDVEFFLEIADLSDKTYYKSAVIKGEFTVKVGETVLISPEDPSTPLHVATIVKI